jgi:predicted nucleotidyltransferase
MNRKGLQHSGIERVVRRFREMVEKVLSSPVQVILFGSYARGEASEGSDVDLLVVVPKLDKKVLDVLLEAAWEVGFEADIVLSVVPVAASQLKILAESPFFQAVQREGIRL